MKCPVCGDALRNGKCPFCGYADSESEREARLKYEAQKAAFSSGPGRPAGKPRGEDKPRAAKPHGGRAAPGGTAPAPRPSGQAPPRKAAGKKPRTAGKEPRAAERRRGGRRGGSLRGLLFKLLVLAWILAWIFAVFGKISSDLEKSRTSGTEDAYYSDAAAPPSWKEE